VWHPDRVSSTADFAFTPIEPEPDELPMMRRYLGFEPHLSLVFAPYGPIDEFTAGQRRICTPSWRWPATESADFSSASTAPTLP
jgi:hypothetical protein